MSVYSIKGKGWRYDFTLKGIRHTEAWFKTKKEATRAEAIKREELKNPPPIQEAVTDMGFLELVNLRLDHVKAYNSDLYYKDIIYMAKNWIKAWGNKDCSEITPQIVEKFVLQRSKVSNFVANKEIRYLRATFNFGIKKKYIGHNPANGMSFLPIEKHVKYVPSYEDIQKVLLVADSDTQDYLITVCDTIARISEINRLTWDDVNLNDRNVILYTRKKKGGNLTPRKISMTTRLHEILSRRYAERDKTMKWVYWHRYWSTKIDDFKEGPYLYRKKIMASLCEKAGVRNFSFHALRHSGASMMDLNNVPLSSIQRILGHENRTTTEIYLHNLGTAEIDAINVLEQAREKSHTKSHIKQKSTQPIVS